MATPKVLWAMDEMMNYQFQSPFEGSESFLMPVDHVPPIPNIGLRVDAGALARAQEEITAVHATDRQVQQMHRLLAAGVTSDSQHAFLDSPEDELKK